MDFKQPKKHFDDVDDFMSQVMGATPSARPSAIPRRVNTPAPRSTHHTAARVRTPTFSPQATPKKVKKRRGKRMVATLFVLMVLATLGYAGYSQKDRISSLFVPPSPFIGKVGAQQYPLYYPSKLPAGFKIELNSIGQPEDGVVVYSISNEKDRRFHISLQSAPSDLNLSTVENTFSDKRTISTNFGEITLGINRTQGEMANIPLGNTWIIINAPVDLLEDEDFKLVIDSFIEGTITES